MSVSDKVGVAAKQTQAKTLEKPFFMHLKQDYQTHRAAAKKNLQNCSRANIKDGFVGHDVRDRPSGKRNPASNHHLHGSDNMNACLAHEVAI